MSGHSKWAQIKHKKAVTDTKKGALFSKLVREITLAAKIGSPQPEVNPQLRQAIEKGRALGLPKLNIERAVERASGKESEALQEFLYEASAPGGAMLLVEGITDNKNRTLAEVKHLLLDYGAKLAEPGSLTWNFDRVGLLEITLEDNPSLKTDDVEFIIIESGAENFKKINQTVLVETALEKRDEVRKSLEARGVKVGESSYDYQPRTVLVLDGAEKAALEVLLGKLSELTDVHEVYTNLSE